MTLEQYMEGDYQGLYGEVVTEDTYKLRQLPWQPDLIFDVGANIGIFSRYARTLFPKALIIAVEPDPKNCEAFRRYTADENIILVERALGVGQIFHGLTARNGSGETYLSIGLGYPMELMRQSILGPAMERSTVVPINLFELVVPYWQPDMKTVIKIDCEGAENTIWHHDPSMSVLASVDYIAMEVHDYALTQEEKITVVNETNKALASLERTHRVTRDGVHMWAIKR